MICEGLSIASAPQVDSCTYVIRRRSCCSGYYPLMRGIRMHLGPKSDSTTIGHWATYGAALSSFLYHKMHVWR